MNRGRPVSGWELRITSWANTVPRYPQIPSAHLWPILVHGHCFSGLPQAFLKEVLLGYWSEKGLGFTSVPQETWPQTVGVQSQTPCLASRKTPSCDLLSRGPYGVRSEITHLLRVSPLPDLYPQLHSVSFPHSSIA